MAAASKPVFTVQVRELVEFCCRRGDLGGQRDFAGARRGLAGIRGHQRIQSSRPAGYQKEVPVSYSVETEHLILWVQGRIDGLLATEAGLVIEEIKTVRGRWGGEVAPLHLAQAKCYAFICAVERVLDAVVIQLTYVELDSSRNDEVHYRVSLDELTAFFTDTTRVYLDWLEERLRWRRLRDASIQSLDFPFPNYRPGQREMAVAVYRVAAQGGCLFTEAPTGIGKTISTVFPTLKAMREGKLERLFFLTARTVGRAVVEKACADLRRAGLRLRVLSLTARDKICAQAGRPCDPEACPLARGYYERWHAAMRSALGREAMNRSVIEAVSLEHQVCPFELSLDLSPWADLLICDYNYVFDPQVYLRRFFTEPARDCVFLVDEAHNLLDRAREMFSADLRPAEVQDAGRAVKTALPRCARALTHLSSALSKLCRNEEPSVKAVVDSGCPVELDLFDRPLPGSPRSPPEAKPAPGTMALRDSMVSVYRQLPEDIPRLLDCALEETESWLALNREAGFRQGLLDLYFRMYSFKRTADRFDQHYAMICDAEPDRRVRLFCVDPAPLLRQALARGKASVLFSGTLTPLSYYRDVLGGGPDDILLRMASPFPAKNLAVLVHDRIRTDLKSRAGSLDEVVEAIAAVTAERPGNYLVYLPSYQYLAAVQQRFHALFPVCPIRVQSPGMSEEEREAFLAAFEAFHKETLVGFALMGGIFGESIDLVGDRLIGVIVVGVGLPQLCVERDLVMECFQGRTGVGFEYAYTFPGINRVLQATGRVIRSETDRGIVLLVDSRFAEVRYRRHLPAWWRPTVVRSSARIRDVVRAFWAGE